MKLPLESARLAAWTTACLNGSVAPDSLADRAVATGHIHRVAGLSALGSPDETVSTAQLGATAVSLPLAITELRRRGAERAWLAWPVPGDPSGLSGPGEVNRIALEAGQAVLIEPLGPAGAIALVPSRLGSSGVLWTAFAVEKPGAAVTSLRDADHTLKTAIRVSTDELDLLDVARVRLEDVEQLSALLDRTPPVELPRGFDPRAHSVLDTTQRLADLLEIARRDDGGAVSRSEAERRSAVLRDLQQAVRHAFTAAVNSLAEDSIRAR